jgi:hypothetical protein
VAGGSTGTWGVYRYRCLPTQEGGDRQAAVALTHLYSLGVFPVMGVQDISPTDKYIRTHSFSPPPQSQFTLGTWWVSLLPSSFAYHVSRFRFWPWWGGSVAKCDVDCLVYKLSFGGLVGDLEVDPPLSAQNSFAWAAQAAKLIGWITLIAGAHEPRSCGRVCRAGLH